MQRKTDRTGDDHHGQDCKSSEDQGEAGRQAHRQSPDGDQDGDSNKRIKTGAPPLVLLDADTGQQVLVTDAAELRRYQLAKSGDENTPAVIAAALRALLAMQSWVV